MSALDLHEAFDGVGLDLISDLLVVNTAQEDEIVNAVQPFARNLGGTPRPA
ncbi:MAG: hypothetical protein ACYDAG_07265 [Chloroflexota bacterium]